VQRIVCEELKAMPITSVISMDDLVNAWIVPERAVAALSAVFGALGTLLAALGPYGLLAYSLTNRMAEIGVRMALGGDSRRHLALGASGRSWVGICRAGHRPAAGRDRSAPGAPSGRRSAR
jgi:hypothetical protein